ncbi:NADH:ubiquinone oxidoreductase [Pseudomonas sp. OIL-1]|uniref:NADH:ubiquinone oxidoreductase n=1 Tax=Pseudomonas sp. OIL-1 TaxID=2706126 RepID=UPI0013A75096|nr:NADH:ubiquinone oxidoreductase [Pseudomonas sp. OIL-1]QIB50481.1 NADH:ubiquinone oxidoreductase [Pseudomonas sp. OIL-1]
MKSILLAPVLLGIIVEVHAGACLIESDDGHEPIRLCQENMTIPQDLFENSFCQPDIPERSFKIEMVDTCPTGAYGICEGSRTDGVGYQQSIYYYSNASDAPVLKAYCEKISRGRWVEPRAQ